MSVTKEHIIKSSLNRLGLTKTKSTQLVDSLLEIIKNSLENGDNVLISGFGKFCVQDNRGRRRHSAYREDLMLGSSRVVIFKCSKVLKDKINESGS
jgi:integration host factor subunit alpha